MSRARIAVLALCTLLVGAGIGYGAANMGGSDTGRRRPGDHGRHDWRDDRVTNAGGPLSACKSDETFGCYQRGFREIVDRQNPGVALDDLDALYKTDAYVRRTCHPLAHEIGHLAYAKYHSVTAAEGFARETCWSGYHHGLMESYISQFNDKQLRAKHERHLQAGRRATPTPSPTTTAGTGSATASRSASSRTSSTRCASATTSATSWERESCYSGVFMQNIVANGSGMHRAIDLKPSDPIYPCDAVSEQEKPSCYLMQTSYVLQVKQWNLPVAFRICDRVEARYVGTCYRSMGRDISGAALLDPGRVVSQCALGAKAHRAECIAGAAANAVYDRHAREKADELCRLAGSGGTRRLSHRHGSGSLDSLEARPPYLPHRTLVSDVCAAYSQRRRSRPLPPWPSASSPAGRRAGTPSTGPPPPPIAARSRAQCRTGRAA